MVLERYIGAKLRQEYGLSCGGSREPLKPACNGYPSLKLSKRDSPGFDSLLLCKTGIIKVPIA